VDAIRLLPGAQPFFYPGGPVGCLLVHGLTGAPQEMRWLGQHLHRQGHTVYGIRLAGHGSTLEDLRRATWREWFLDVLAGHEVLRAQCERVFAIGLSMGGALCLLLAAREPVDGVVSLSAPYEVRDWRTPLLPILSHLIPLLPKKPPSPEQAAFQQRVMDEQRRRGEPAIGHVSYPAWPLTAVGELIGLLAEVRAGLPEVSAPALLIHSQRDDVVPFENLAGYAARIGSADVQTMVLEHSLHVVTEDGERDRVFDAVTRFIAQHT